MPSTITHGYIGLDTIKKLNKKPRDMLEKHLNNYKVYCQSADVLYFYHVLLLKSNSIQQLGHEFHNKNVFKSFAYLINLNKQNKDEELFTLIAGMITHYQADSTMHPYINSLAESKSKLEHQNKHFEIETYIDNYLVHEYEKTNPQKHKHYQLIFNYEKKDIIVDSLNKLFKDIFAKEKIGEIYYQALKEMSFVFKYVRHDDLGIKKTIYKLIDHNPFKVRKTQYLSYHFPLNNNEYYLNLTHREWHHFKNESTISHESFFDLYDKVIKNSSNIINNLYAYIYEDKNINLYTLIGNNSYSTGLPLKE